MTNPSNIWSKTAVIAAALIISCVMQWVTASAQPFATVRDNADGTEYMAGQILIKFKEAATDGELADAARRGGLGGLIRHIHTDAMKTEGSSGISHMWTGLPVQAAIQALAKNPAVEFAEPNFVYKHQAAPPSDAYFFNGSLWGMYGDASSPANQYGSQAAEAWAATTYIGTGASDVVVGVIDEGIQFTHPDLAVNIWTNRLDPVDGIDNDSNGYVDDVHGWNCVNNNNVIYTPGQDAHGTHVSGTIGAAANGIGVVGVNWNVTIISGKFLGPNGGSLADAVEAVDYFTDLKGRHGMKLVAINNSWGGGGYSQSLHDAIIRAAKKDILFIAAAGNGDFLGQAINNDTSATYPANYDTTVGTSTQSAASYNSVIAVTAIDSAGAKATWANYGATKVHLGAPGVNINSTLPTDTYGAYNGTSMATPHVTGAAALYASTHPSANARDIRNALLNSTIPTSSLAGKTVTGGRLNLSSVIDPSYTPPPLPQPPNAPTDLKATAISRSQINLSWLPGASGAAATGFKIERSRNGGSFSQIATVVAVPGVNTFNNTGLSRNTTYNYRVRGYNAAGNSAYSTIKSAKTFN